MATIATIVSIGSAQQLTTVRFSVASPAALDSVRRLGIDVVEVHPRQGGGMDLVAVADSRERGLLQSRGWAPAEVPRAPQMQLMEVQRAARGAAAFVNYRDFDDPVRGIAAYLRSFDSTHTNVAVDSIGATLQGRPILAAKIGPSGDAGNRPNVLFMATYHAREWASTYMALRLMEYLADSLGGSSILNNRDVWVIPVANPDGYQYTFSTERLWRKNRSVNSDGSFGTDLNRNHNAFWGFDDAGSSDVPASEIYRGTRAASEPEVRAIEAFHRAHPMAASISYHTYTGVVLYPWSHAYGIRSGDDAIFRALAGTDVLPAIPDSVPGSINTYYHPGPGWQLYTVNGDYTSYAYLRARTLAFTVELTSGCCVGGAYYGFEFPDNDQMLSRMFHDNLPFALGLIVAAGNPTTSTIPPGVPVASPQIESVWPELRALVSAPALVGSLLDVAIDSAVVAVRVAQRDSLGLGRGYARVQAVDPTLEDLRAARLPTEGLGAELLARDGAEQPTTGWTGFRRDSSGYRSLMSWRGYNDTLTSPIIPATGRSNLSLYFWTRHLGSVFQQIQRGLVQVSSDGGAHWSTVAQAVGYAPEWYPIAIPLSGMPGATQVRLRFVAQGMDWWIEDVALASSDAQLSRLFPSGSSQVQAQIEVSANPVRSAPVTLRWPAGTGTAQMQIFSVTGTRIFTVTQSPDQGRFQWDLTTDGGQSVANGAYYILVAQGNGGATMRRRLLIAR